MKILIYGAGVIGSVFAGKLALSGNNVTVLARNKRYNEIQKNGIILINAKTNKKEQVPVTVISELLPNDFYDYILIVMQRTQVDETLSFLSQNCSPNILFVVNTALGYDKWADAIGKERLMLGFPSAGGVRNNEEVLYFIGKGVQRIFQTTTFGEYNGTKSKRIETILQLFNGAKIPSVFCSDMNAWQKTHVALVTNIANALYGFDCDNYKLGRSYRDMQDMILGIKEGRRVLHRLGIRPTPGKLWWLDLPVHILSIIFAVFMRTKLAEITMAKHCIAAKQEMICLQKEFDVLISQSKMDTQIINKLKKNLYRTK